MSRNETYTYKTDNSVTIGFHNSAVTLCPGEVGSTNYFFRRPMNKNEGNAAQNNASQMFPVHETYSCGGLGKQRTEGEEGERGEGELG